MTDAHHLEDAEAQNLIKLFSDAILRQKSGNFPKLKTSSDGFVFPSTDGITSNRGHKLLQNSEGVSRTSLRNLSGNREEQVFYNGSVHKLLARNRQCDDDDDNDGGFSINLHELVNVRKILAPISSLEDVAKHPAISRTFKNKVLGELALQAVLMMEKEQNNVVALSRLLEAFLGDYPGPLLEDTLKLKEYDHNLKLHDDTDDNQVVQPSDHEREDTNVDPFFALPQLYPSNALPSVISDTQDEAIEQVEAARQLAQIALQRNQEFIRNLQKIRNCIVKAERIKDRISMWGREYAGIPEEGVTIPSALHLVKRGLISATTNKTMMEEQIEDEPEEDLI
ncbi:LANO_0E06480g1_1 [Lachancea nothofagi CBS 11611]|uniref:LANO_0E06480g1_1 n=1 Tax=Lachancea nothofagi CBS 11611 TaxID=1266666 RepID=A0A1G4JTU6_9SACH|nr:LANO_0E06480g1_1 [Lachancea nothofagi CBS 11611]